jgi:hypothetical protein
MQTIVFCKIEKCVDERNERLSLLTLISSASKTKLSVTAHTHTGMAQRAIYVTQDFVQPGTSQTVIVKISDIGDYSTNDVVYVSGGGYYKVTAVPNSTSVALLNFGASGNTPPTAIIKAGAVLQLYRNEVSITSDSTNTIISGTGPPTSAVGFNGDFYIDTATSTMYGPKASDEWPPAATPLSGNTIFNGSGAPDH